MNLKKQAKKIREAGRVNSVSGQDTSLIHASPSEEAILKMLGGSGRIDPQTGLPHYDAGGLRGDSNAGNASGGYGGGDSRSGNSTDRNGLTSNQVGYGYRAGTGDIAGSRYGEDVSSNTYGGWGGVGGALSGLLTGNPAMMAKGAYSGVQGNTVNNGSKDTSRSNGNIQNGYYTPSGSFTPTSGTYNNASVSSSIFPSVYSDPVTGRLLFNAQSGSNSSNSSISDQQMLDALMGTKVANSNINQSLSALQGARAKAAASGADTSWYDSEISRLGSMSNSAVTEANNPLLAYTDSGLGEQNANNVLDNTVANQMALGENQNARRGLLNSSMQDAVRASLGLSTAQGRLANKQAAQDTAMKNKLNLMGFLKSSQQQDNTLANQGNQTALELANQENQRQIAEKTMGNQNALAAQNLNYLNGVQSNNNTNAWINALGNAAGSIDWGSLFG